MKNVLSKSINKYYTDITDSDLCYGLLIKSPISSGTIREISHPSLPKDYVIITAKNIPQNNFVLTNNISIPVLAYETISYIGQPIGILVGPNQIILNDLIKEIEIKYTEAQETNKDSVNTNIFASRQVVHGESELLYTESAIQIKRTYASKLHFTRTRETLGAIVSYTKKRFNVYAPTQWPLHLRNAICNVFGCKKEDVTINKTISDNNATNSLWFTSIIACQAALASFIINKPVKISLTREEQKCFIDSPIVVHTSFEIALEVDGTIRAMNADLSLECGAFCPFAHEIIDRMIIALASVYKFNRFCIVAYAKNSPTPPLSADLHLTDFQSFFALENMMQDISSHLHIYPNELRYRNLISKQNNYPFQINNNKLSSVIEKVVKESDFLRKYVSYGLASKDNMNLFPLRGIGLSCAFEGSGFFGASVNESNLTMEVTIQAGGIVVIKAPIPPDAILDIWKSIASSILEVDKVNISLDTELEDVVEPELPNITADNISILTNLLKKCCTAIQKQRFRHPLPITIKRSVISNKNKKWNSNSFSGEPFHSTSLIAAVTELELDPCTFSPKIHSIWIAIDGGEIINKQRAIISVKKAIYQTLLFSIPYISFTDIPMYIYFMDSNEEPKEIGDLVYNALPSSITIALSTATHQQISVLPLAPDSLYYPLIKEDKENEN